jgi:hypothetical protein
MPIAAGKVKRMNDEPRGYTESEWREMIQNDEVRMYPDMADKFRAIEVRMEYNRLRGAVADAAKTEMRDNPFLSSTSSTAFMVAVADLITFEKKHGLGQ